VQTEVQPEAPAQGPSLTQLGTDPSTRLERDVVMAMLQHPQAVGRDFINRVAGVRFGDESLAVVRDAIATSVDRLESPTWLQVIAAEVPAHYSMLVQQLGVAPIPAREDFMAAYCVSLAVAVVDRDLLRRKKELVGALQRTDSAADATKYQSLQRELVAIEADRRAIRPE
jgi:DNA primase